VEEIKKVVVSGLEIPFWDLVWFMVKLALASIPALFVIYFIVMLFGMVFGGMVHMFMGVPPVGVQPECRGDRNGDGFDPYLPAASVPL